MLTEIVFLLFIHFHIYVYIYFNYFCDSPCYACVCSTQVDVVARAVDADNLIISDSLLCFFIQVNAQNYLVWVDHTTSVLGTQHSFININHVI